MNYNIYEQLSSDNDSVDKNYMEPSILNNINLEKFFSKDDLNKSVLNNKELKITDKGLYSISKFYDAQWITDIIITFLKNNNLNPLQESIIDGTAGIGGNTINFSKYFSKVYAIEINNIHYDVLNNNINALLITNVEIYLNNFLTIIDKFSKKSTIFFLDPPWGGNSYKNYKYFNLKIGKLQLYAVLNILYDNNYKYVILKAPFNLNLSIVYANIKYKNMNVFSNNKKNMIIIIFY
jgi:16S rRNA G966 N2-methylase RsmD